MSDNEPREYPPGVVHLEREARALHEQVERIALAERRNIAVSTLACAAVCGVAGLVWQALGNAGMVLVSAVAVGVLLGEYAWLRFTRPSSVKPWGAEQ